MQDGIAERLNDSPPARILDLVINSQGGTFDARMALYRMLRWYPAPTKRAYLKHQCSSAAWLVAMAADERIASSGTEVLFHFVA